MSEKCKKCKKDLGFWRDYDSCVECRNKETEIEIEKNDNKLQLSDKITDLDKEIQETWKIVNKNKNTTTSWMAGGLALGDLKWSTQLQNQQATNDLLRTIVRQNKIIIKLLEKK